jgi:8-oxo-dGTP pyrophosphatase MutT (NUDIX family)
LVIEREHENLVYTNRFIHVYDDQVRFADGRRGDYVRIRSAAEGRGVVILALRGGHVGLVRTYRYAIGRHQWGLPRGFGHNIDESMSVRGELLEETGAEASSIDRLGVITPDSGLLSDEVAIYMALVPDIETAPVDTVEVAALEWVHPDDLDRRIRSGEIDDGFTLAAWCLYRLSQAADSP